MTASGNSGMPDGDTYEDNAYTRYLKKTLNVQNEDVLEVSGDENYYLYIQRMIAENNLPDVMLVSGPEEVEELAEYGMIEDLSDSYQEATSSRIKSMYSSYGKELLESVTIDGKLMALPSTQVYYGCNLFWVREDWRKELGLPEPSTLADVEQIIQAFRENDPGGNEMAILEVNNVKKIYTTRFGSNKVQALSDVSFSVEEGEYVAVMGESGSGKTTLLNIIAALDKPTDGEVYLNGRRFSDIKEAEIAKFRREHLGFVFQEFNLLDNFSIKDNILLPLVLAGKQYHEMDKRLTPVARKLGISEILSKYPYEVSGGQKQRAAVARAIITDPQLILADEPTGALDSKASDELLSLFSSINNDGQTIIMVTHSVKAASNAGRVLFIKDGRVFHQIYRGASSNEQMYQKISDTLTVLAKGGEHDA